MLVNIRRFIAFFMLFFFVALLVFCISGNTGNGDFRRAPNHIRLTTVDDLYRFLTYHEKRFPLISAHRGGPTTGYPENALETFENTYRQQPVIIECDVQMTHDSVLVLLHDETLERTTTGSGKLSDIRFTELKKVRLKDPAGKITGFRIPTLDEALRWGAGKVAFTIDVKRGTLYARVVEAIRRNRAEAYSIVITYSADQAAMVHQLAPDLMISASIQSADDLARLSNRNIPDNRIVAFVGTREADQHLYDLLHRHGILCILGTMGNLDKQANVRGDSVYSRLVERGADILSTDRPLQAGRALHIHRSKNKITSPFIN